MQEKKCKNCKIVLIPEVNCKPSTIKHGAYCRECLANRNKEKYFGNLIENRQKGKDHAKKWREANPEKYLALQIRSYGISLEEYYQMRNQQNGLCKLCGNPPGVNPRQKRLCIDHDPETGRIRGLLCDTCNRALGMLGDTKDSLKKVVDYLTC